MEPSRTAPPDAPPSAITPLLTAWEGGDSAAGDRLFRAVYVELRRQAAHAMRGQAAGHTPRTTALMYEAYPRLVDRHGPAWGGRAHFFGVAARAMRHVLVDHARIRRAAKRGGGARPLTLGALEGADAAGAAAPTSVLGLLALHEALDRLAALDAAQARIVELRYFGGLTGAETAEALGVSPATVRREWATARAWLRRELATPCAR